jgi:transcriptional regulator GlxA family with amidase domain
MAIYLKSCLSGNGCSQTSFKSRQILPNSGLLKASIAQFLQSKFSIDEVAEFSGISPRHFKRRFKSATGETPLAYLQRLRIENAKRLLERTLDPINAITWRAGYEDINSFRRLFIKHTGLSPKRYRNKFSRSPVGQGSNLDL